MRLNNIQPNKCAKHYKKRLGRGIGSGFGKTAGRGHKGQKSRSGGFHKICFEGGQMPLYRRLPKRGFKSIKRFYTAEIRLSDLENLNISKIDISTLKNANIISKFVRVVRIILSGNLNKKIILKGLKVSKGAKIAIEKIGGSIR